MALVPEAPRLRMGAWRSEQGHTPPRLGHGVPAMGPGHGSRPVLRGAEDWTEWTWGVPLPRQPQELVSPLQRVWIHKRQYGCPPHAFRDPQ